MLDGLLSGIYDHGGQPGTPVLFFVATFFVGLAVVLLIGSVMGLLTTDIGFPKAFMLTVGTVLGYLAMHSVTWVLTGNGPRTSQTAMSYFGQRGIGMAIGVVCLSLFVLVAFLWHRTERALQRSTD